MKLKIIFLLLFIFLTIKIFAQQGSDSLIRKHSPRKAALMSMVFPGAGQLYNKKYWKIPVMYAGFAGMGYLIQFNDKRYQQYKEAFILRADGDPDTIDEFVDKYSDSDLQTLKSFYRRNRDLSIIVAGLIYALNIVDASVDAHLFYFDVSDDLSLHYSPAFNLDFQSKPFTGINLSLSF